LRQRHAFTLVEIIIGFAIMVVFAAGVFRIFNSANRANAQSLWYSKAQAQARSVLAQVRNDLAQATCPSTVTASSVDRTACSLTYKDGETLLTPGGAEVELLRFSVCTPTISTGGPEDKGGKESTCVLRAFGTTLNYTREGDALPAMNKDLVTDVVRVLIEVRGNSGEAFDQEGNLVDITLDLQHSNPGQFPHAKLSERSAARAPVPASAS
jgi:type II secretory pathway pseudopilin PulG